jgi:hypothetical protein
MRVRTKEANQSLSFSRIRSSERFSSEKRITRRSEAPVGGGGAGAGMRLFVSQRGKIERGTSEEKGHTSTPLYSLHNNSLGGGDILTALGLLDFPGHRERTRIFFICWCMCIRSWVYVQ